LRADCEPDAGSAGEPQGIGQGRIGKGHGEIFVLFAVDGNHLIFKKNPVLLGLFKESGV
jgi:hypothetical protein